MASAISFADGNSGLQAGMIHGAVSTTFHQHHYATPERPETPPKPSIIIPFARDKDFVRPGTILDQVQEACAKPDARVALVGLGGIGKSQIAIEYAYQVRDRSPDTWVFWVHASNAARYEQSIRDIADHVKITGRQDPQCNIFQLLCNWLRSDKSGKWTIILDNVDDAGFLVAAPSQSPDVQSDSRDNVASSTSPSAAPLISYLPHSSSGSILITSRYRDTAQSIVEDHDIVAVEPMSQQDAVALVQQKLEDLNDQEDTTTNAGELVSALEYMPLAIVQATSYIRHRAPRCSLKQYIKKLQESEEKKMGLLDEDGGRLRRDSEANNSIILTWQISFDHLYENEPRAADLLSLMSFCDRQGIPDSLLRGPGKHLSRVKMKEGESEERKSQQEETSIHRPKLKHWCCIWPACLDRNRESRQCKTQQENETREHTKTSSDHRDLSFKSDEDFEEAISSLRDYSFISSNKNGTSLEMHRLVQLSMRRWLETQGRKEEWQQNFVNRLCSHLPDGEYKNWPVWKILFPHAKAAARLWSEEDTSPIALATILHQASGYLYKICAFNEAEQMSMAALDIRIKLLGREHKDSLFAMNTLGLIRISQGRLEEAEELQTEVVRILNAKGRVTDLATTIAMNNLAMLFADRGLYEDAEKILTEIIMVAREFGRTDSTHTRVFIRNLSKIHLSQGRLDDAEKFLMKAIEDQKASSGITDIHTLVDESLLMSVYNSQGHHQKAERLGVESVENCKEKLGVRHFTTLNCMLELALAHLSQGHLDEAERLALETLNAHRSRSGADHPNTLRSSMVVARIYCAQGQTEIAEKLALDVMETWKARSGAQHPGTLFAMRHLASIWYERGYHVKAKSLLRTCLRSTTEASGSPNLQTILIAKQLSAWEAQSVSASSDLSD
ncbi:hypothetical protein PFICI_10597 [Pestalotiopsis fici W106-1]|uniref:Uncharacterized protein n=1 Tax=Pestalotiopsis fici (strain W106-1 / CGMCC3.15140) TaxID=1229662 RepID=W3WXG1_PESFW|nr:uncharacterized protein PFICI_10597 [Pestalotiopsis fici W106-1]ETS78535.1 hypothetical protein PFICI_10597 [Pestalotiopsis fici W106-1]